MEPESPDAYVIYARADEPFVCDLVKGLPSLEFALVDHQDFEQDENWEVAVQQTIEVKNAQRSKTVKVLSRGYANVSSGASIKARFQKSGSS